MKKKNLKKNTFLFIDNHPTATRFFFVLCSLFIAFYNKIPYNSELALLIILLIFVFQLTYLVFLILNKKIIFLGVHYVSMLFFIYVVCIYNMLGKQDLFLFVNFLLHCVHLITTNYFQIEASVNCPETENGKEIKEFKKNIFLENIFKNQKLQSITYFFLKDYNKFLITFFYFSNLNFYISGELHLIF